MDNMERKLKWLLVLVECVVSGFWIWRYFFLIKSEREIGCVLNFLLFGD